MDLLLYCFGAFILIIILVLIRTNYKNSKIEKIILNKIDRSESRLYSKQGRTTVAPTIKHDNWCYNERNLQKALLKGRRRGHLRIMYHGEWYPTGLKTVTV